MANTMNMQLALLFSNGMLSGQQIPVRKSEIRIGSDANLNDLALNDPSLMPEHARIVADNDRYIIQRRDSQSLLLINFQPVEYAILQDGDQVTLGQPGLSFTAYISPATPVALSVPPTPIEQPTPVALFSSPEPFLPANEAAFRIPTSTSPQFAFPGIGHPQQQIPVAQMAPQAQMPPELMPPIQAAPMAPSPQAPLQASYQASYQVPYTETTRYLCAAAHLDEKFQRFVLRTIVGEEHRAIGEAYGVDIIPVLKVSYAAQQRTFIRDCILFVILLAAVAFTWLSIASLFGAMHTATTATAASPYGAANPYTGLISSFLTTTFAILAIFLLFFYLLGVLVVSFIARLFSSRIRPAMIFLLAFLLFYWYAIPFFLIAWLVVAIERAIRFYGATANLLTKHTFNPGNLPYPLNPQVEQKARAVFQPQDGNVVVYSGYTPFAGAGIRAGGWSFPVDITKGKREAGISELKPKTFELDEIYTHVTDALKKLDLEGKSQLCGTVSIEDKLYVNGQEIRNDMRFLREPFSRPYNQIDEGLIREFMLNPSQDIRFYKCIRLTSWRGEMVLSIFYRFVLVANSLYTEVDYLLLPPLKNVYHAIDTIEPTFNVHKVWNIVKSSFAVTAELFLSSPAKVFNHIFASWLYTREQRRIERSIKDNPAFDYGTRTSLREVVSDDNYHRYFQYLDKEMYIKIIERQLLDSIVKFLDARDIDTSELKKRQDTILNNGVIVSGGSFTAGNMAVGAQANASISAIGGSPAEAPTNFAAPAMP